LNHPHRVDVLRAAIHATRDRARLLGWRRAIRQTVAGPAPPDVADYAAWSAAHCPSAAALAAQRRTVADWPSPPRVSVITPAYNSEPEWLQECYASLVAQSYPHWEWCVADDASTAAGTRSTLRALADDPRVIVVWLPDNQGIARASNAALRAGTGNICVLLDHDDTLAPEALFEVASAFHAQPTIELLYSDEDKREVDGTPCDPYFKPDWSPDLFLSTMYACHLTAMRRSLVDRVGGFADGFDGAQDYDLWLRMTEATAHVHHIPRVLYHWRKVPGSTAASQSAKPAATDAGLRAVRAALSRRQLAADAEPGLRPGHYRIRYRHAASLTSVLMPTYGGSATAEQAQRAASAVASLCATSPDGALEFVCATEDGTVPAAVIAAAGQAPLRTVHVPGPFNFSSRINAAAAAARGPVLLLANDDIEATAPGWLDALRDYALQPEIGAAGPRLDLPDGRVQHAGILLGVRGIAAHAFHHAPGTHEGYFGSLISPRNLSAITGACLMTRAAVFHDVGGFDPALPIDFNDVDYCLRLRQRGLRIVCTPFARLTHHEGASLGTRAPGAAATRVMRERWQATIARDPYYNPNLSTDTVDYRFADSRNA
jgi:GT2 family glycosyltransferase